MSLDYNVAKVEDYRNLPPMALHDACMTLMLIGVSKVTDAVIPIIETRLEFLMMIGVVSREGRAIDWPRFIGLTTNVSNETDASFRKRIANNLWFEANRAVRHRAYMRSTKENQ